MERKPLNYPYRGYRVTDTRGGVLLAITHESTDTLVDHAPDLAAAIALIDGWLNGDDGR